MMENFIKVSKHALKDGKLAVIYLRRIVFVKNNFKVSLPRKLSANLFGGYLADQYVLYDFRHNDRRKYLSEYDWYRSRYINEPFEFLLNNKIACTQVLQQYIDVPEIFVIKHGGIFSSYEKALLTEDEVMDTVRSRKDVFIKPYGKGKGTGVKRLSFSDGVWKIDDRPVRDEDMRKLLADTDEWIICRNVEQGAFPKSLYDRTVNTIRMITVRDIHTQQFRIMFAVQRIGTSETIPVDNGSRGGLVCNIDLETGTLSEARSLHSLDVHETHPDSGTRLKGAVIPGWDGIKNRCWISRRSSRTCISSPGIWF